MIKFLISVLKRKIVMWHYKSVKSAYTKSFYPYLKYNDTITDAWYIFEEYEKNINNFIDSYTTRGYKNFFIDIGANIGLTTLSNSSKFDDIYCFEPNSLVFNILKTNIAMSSDENKITLFNVGLGLTRGKYNLKIPRHNFGGAFVEKDNAYNKETLLEKDGFLDEKSENYIDTIIDIESKDFLEKNVTSKLEKSSEGIVKIDVEGYELQILELILKTINVKKLVIIFENWQKIDQKIIEKMVIQNSSFSSFKIKYIKWLNSYYDKLRLKSIYSNPIPLDRNNPNIPEKCDIILEVEN